MRALALAFLFVCGAALGFSSDIDANSLPAEARQTIAIIKSGGPFPYSRDGVVFNNREGQLPKKARGYYHEYTVKTPGARDRGTRRIISGRDGELYYTDDHYRTFRRVIGNMSE